MFHIVIMRYCTPRQFADNGHGVHVDTVASHLLRFIYRMCGVADVDGHKTPSHIDMQVFVRYAEMHRQACHCAHDARGVGPAFHQQYARAYKQVSLAPQCSERHSVVHNVIALLNKNKCGKKYIANCGNMPY